MASIQRPGPCDLRLMKREAPGARLCESQQRAMAQSSPGSPGNPVCQCAQISLQFLCRCMECSINNAVADCRNAHVILCLRAGVRCCGSQTRAPERDSGRDGSKQSGISRQSCLPMRADEPSIPLPLHGIFNQQCRCCWLSECARDPAPACWRALLRVTDSRSGAEVTAHCLRRERLRYGSGLRQCCGPTSARTRLRSASAWQDPPSLSFGVAGPAFAQLRRGRTRLRWLRRGRTRLRSASAWQDPPSLSFGVAGPAFAQLRRGRLLAPPNLGQEEFQRFSLSAFQHLYCFPLRVYCLA